MAHAPKNPAAPTMQIGRHVRTPQTPTTAAVRDAMLRRRLERQDSARQQAAASDAEAKAKKDAEHARDCRDVALLRAGAVGLSGPDVRKLSNVVEAHRREAVRTGKSFDIYKTLDEKLVDFGHGVRIRTNSLPLAAPTVHLDAHGNPAPMSPEERLEQQRRHEDRARKVYEANMRDREAYQSALRRLGLQDPAFATFIK